jgi:hypothetical protein
MVTLTRFGQARSILAVFVHGMLSIRFTAALVSSNQTFDPDGRAAAAKTSAGEEREHPMTPT